MKAGGHGQWGHRTQVGGAAGAQIESKGQQGCGSVPAPSPSPPTLEREALLEAALASSAAGGFSRARGKGEQSQMFKL